MEGGNGGLGNKDIAEETDASFTTSHSAATYGTR